MPTAHGGWPRLWTKGGLSIASRLARLRVFPRRRELLRGRARNSRVVREMEALFGRALWQPRCSEWVRHLLVDDLNEEG